MPASTSQSALPGLIRYEASDRVSDILASMGRTEDVRLSPSGTRLAVACYLRNEIAVFELAIARSADGTVGVELTGAAFHGSPAFEEPHGLDFVDDETLVVANRGGALVVLRIPAPGAPGDAHTTASISCQLGAAGSVTARPRSSRGTELLAVHNWASSVACYRLGDDGSIRGGEVVLWRWLDLPDGLASSTLGDWLAVSNHDTHDVLVFAAPFERDSDPTAILRGVMYPHGLRFARDDGLLLVADAGAPYVSVFARPGATWSGVSYPANAIRVMDDDTFAAGRHNPQEGGPKGIDVDGRTNVLVVTAERTPLVFLDLERALEAAHAMPVDDLVRYELERLRGLAEAKEQTAEARAQLDAVLRTKAWRLTSPLRGAYGALRRRG